jgi:hypothetical protein
VFGGGLKLLMVNQAVGEVRGGGVRVLASERQDQPSYQDPSHFELNHQDLFVKFSGLTWFLYISRLESHDVFRVSLFIWRKSKLVLVLWQMPVGKLQRNQHRNEMDK